MKQRWLFLLLVTLSLFLVSCKKNGCIERHKKDCVILMIYAPVCGCNGKTYSNSGDAECAGIEDYTEGACVE